MSATVRQAHLFFVWEDSVEALWLGCWTHALALTNRPRSWVVVVRQLGAREATPRPRSPFHIPPITWARLGSMLPKFGCSGEYFPASSYFPVTSQLPLSICGPHAHFMLTA
jgi:hypothetical protein